MQGNRDGHVARMGATLIQVVAAIGLQMALPTGARADLLGDLKRQAERAVQDQLKVPRVPAVPADTQDPPARQQQPVQPAGRAPRGPAAGDAAVAGHLHPVKTFTSSNEIFPVRLPVIDGAPVIGYGALNIAPAQREPYFRGDVDAIRWLLLMHIAHRPGVLDNPQFAKHAAVAFLLPEAWDEYFSCILDDKPCTQVLAANRGRAGQIDADSIFKASYVRDWKGKNEFERPRSHKAFVAKYGPILRSQASALPQEVVLVSSLSLHKPYSEKDQMLPLGDAGRFVDSKVTLPLIGPYCIPLAMNWPAGISATAAQAEALLGRLEQRTAYLAVRIRLTQVDGDGSFVTYTSIGSAANGNCRSEAQVLDLSVFADKALTNKVHTFALPKTVPKAASKMSAAADTAGMARAGPARTAGPNVAGTGEERPTMLLNYETLRLLVVRHKSNWRELIDLRTFVLDRSQLEQAYYQRRSDPPWPSYDPWGPFFAGDVAGRTEFEPRLVDEFAAWTQKRAASLPSTLLARFYGLGKGDMLISAQADNGTGLAGYNVEVPGIYEGDGIRWVSRRVAAAGIAPADHILPMAVGAWAGNGTRAVRDAAIVFPAPVTSYRVSAAEAASTLNRGNIVAEMFLAIGEVKLIAAEGGGEILVVRVTPYRQRVISERDGATLVSGRL